MRVMQLPKNRSSQTLEFAKKEFKLNYKTIIPCNLYGKWDKFDPENSSYDPISY